MKKHVARVRRTSGLFEVWCGIVVGPTVVAIALPRSNCIECLEHADLAKKLGPVGRQHLKELRFMDRMMRGLDGAGPSSLAAKTDTRYNTVCKCGKPAYQGFTSFECSGGCK